MKPWKILAVGFAAVTLLAACDGAPATSANAESAAPSTAESVAPDPDVAEADADETAPADTGAANGPTFILNPDMQVSCQMDVDVEVLQPAHNDPVMLEEDFGSISATEFSSCRITLDTDNNGIINAWDELSDALYLSGGLLEALDGSVADAGFLEDPAMWGNVCTGTREPYAADGWTNASVCVEDGRWMSIYYLLLGETPDGTPAAISCGVDGTGGDINGRESDIDYVCGQVRDYFTSGV